MSIEPQKYDLHKIFKYLLILIPIGVVGNVIFTLLKTDRQILTVLHSFTYQYLLFALILTLIPWFTNTLRVWLWTRFLKNGLSLKNAFSIVLATEMGSAISPTAVGGGYVKLGMLIQKGFPPGSAASVMILGTFEDMLFFTLAAPLAIGYTGTKNMPVLQKAWASIQSRFGSIAWVAGGLSVLILCIILLHHWHLRERLKKTRLYRKVCLQLRKFIRDFVSVYHDIGRKGKWLFLLTMTLTAIQWICRYSVITALLACFNIEIKPILFFLLQWVVFTMGTFIPTPGGAVGVEAAFYFVYNAYIPANLIGLATASWRFLTYYVLLTIGSVLFTALNWSTIHSKHGQSDRRLH